MNRWVKGMAVLRLRSRQSSFVELDILPTQVHYKIIDFYSIANQYMIVCLIMQGIVVFASIMATLGLQILLESGRQFIAKVCAYMSYLSSFETRMD